MNFDELATKIVGLMGGRENISNYTHCATRLRFQVRNKAVIRADELNAMPEILSVVDRGGQYQLVIGPTVESLFHSMEKICPITDNGKEEGREDKKEDKKGALDSVLSFISGSISPALPVMVASGLINAVLALLVQFGGMQKDNGTYILLSAVADAAFYYLPVLIAFAGARRLKTNEYIAAFIALAMIHPAINNVDGLSLIGMNLITVKYSSNIIPVLLMLPVMAVVDKFITRIVPDAMKFILRPFLITAVMVPAIVFVLGPVGAVVGGLLAKLCVTLSNYGAISIGIMSFLQPILVLTGMHTLLVPLIVNEIATYGYSFIFCKALAANFAIAGAAVAVGVKSKKKENKQIGFSTGLTALLSVTEPAVYGCLIPLRRPFVTAVIASGVCGIAIGILKIHSYATASVSLLTLPIFIGEDLNNFILACIMAAVTFAVSFLLTFIAGVNKED